MKTIPEILSTLTLVAERLSRGAGFDDASLRRDMAELRADGRGHAKAAACQVEEVLDTLKEHPSKAIDLSRELREIVRFVERGMKEHPATKKVFVDGATFPPPMKLNSTLVSIGSGLLQPGAALCFAYMVEAPTKIAQLFANFDNYNLDVRQIVVGTQQVMKGPIPLAYFKAEPILEGDLKARAWFQQNVNWPALQAGQNFMVEVYNPPITPVCRVSLYAEVLEMRR